MSGPAPGTGCQVCESPHAAEINAELSLRKMSNRAVGRKFGVSKDSVSRHVFKQHPGAPAPGRGATPASGDTQLDRLKLIRQQLEEDMAQRPRAETSRELRQVNQRIGELEGTDRPREARVEDVEGLPEQVAAWFRALEPYPEAREAMMQATRPELLDRAGKPS